ncbi:hypothetical protein BDQ94DRAFT_135337 [Aspergillus welwitschiae]|uniref:Secreted protein n=1 Tax=Aspergillus welwitschiae TaxID=1341132 RepID=A0A3F3QH11_9EURO|nr:hypothetical protein BDQ94DRAFT_135337 [Aspergillus welwitschiae]RDH37936.1 hypothetical protein BDQ94DRAFT_135337 [Aspergillus welwitschiae]
MRLGFLHLALVLQLIPFPPSSPLQLPSNMGFAGGVVWRSGRQTPGRAPQKSAETDMDMGLLAVLNSRGKQESHWVSFFFATSDYCYQLVPRYQTKWKRQK